MNTKMKTNTKDENEEENENENENENEAEGITKRQILGAVGVVVVAVVGGIALPYIKPWSIRFGIPAICSVVATIFFLTGTPYYNRVKPVGSPLTTTLRLFIAAASKISQPSPEPKQLYNDEDARSTNILRCLDKAAIVLSIVPLEEQKAKKWELCSVREVEETKIGIGMFPMWTTFIMTGLVLSIGNTYFLEQANNMDLTLGRITVPIPIFLVFYRISSLISGNFYTFLESHLPKKYAPPVGIAASMVFSVLCCVTAAKVETRRLHVIRDHGLLDKPDEKIPMSIFWLLPQFILLAALEGISNTSITAFFENQVPESTHKYLASSKSQVPKTLHDYLPYFTKGVLGLGTMASVLSVYVAVKISERNQKPNWFQYTLNKSRLDRYYWTLAALSAVNLVVYIVIACFYEEPESGGNKEGQCVEMPEVVQEHV